MSALSAISPPTVAHFDEMLAKQVELVQNVLGERLATAFLPVLVTFAAKQQPEGGFAEEMTFSILHHFQAERRYAILRGVGRDMGLKEQFVHMMFFCSEAWLSVQDGPKRKYQTASADPNKLEVVCVSGMTMDQKFNMAYVPVERDRQERMIGQAPVFNLCATGEGNMDSDLCRTFYAGLATGLAEALLGRKARYN